MPWLSTSEWEDFLARHPEAHILQTAAWGELKADFGWEVHRCVADGTGAQLLFRSLPLGFTIAYIPKGPVYGLQGPGNEPRDSVDEPAREQFWTEIDALCRQRRAIALKVEPDLWQDPANGGAAKPPPGFRHSSHAIQPPRTILVDLQDDEEAIQARMKQKTRYNIRLASRKEVVVRSSADVEAFYELIAVTGERNEFGVHNAAYYRRAYELFHPRGDCELLVAEYQHQRLAALMVFSHGSRAWYFYGASLEEHRERMPTYRLQWEAMRWARARGCLTYDLWGIPDEEEHTLEDQFTHRSDGLWGVYRFKRGFGGVVRRAQGPWDRVYQPWMYRAMMWWLGRQDS